MSDYVNRDQISRELTTVQTFTFLWKYTRGARTEFFGCALLIFTGGFLGASAASRFGSLLENFWKSPGSYTPSQVYILAAMELGGVLTIFVGRRGLSVSALKAIYSLRHELFDHMKRLPMRYYDREPTGRIVTRLTHDVDTLEAFYSGTLARLASVFLTAGTVLIVMMMHVWYLGVISFLLMIPSIALIWSFRFKAHELYRLYARTNSAITARLAEFLNGMGVIRAFGLEDWSKKLFQERIEHFRDISDKVNYFNTWIRPATLFLTQLPTLFLFGFGGWMVSANLLGLGALIAFLRLADRLARPAGTLMMEINVIQTAISSTERLTTFLEEPIEVVSPPQPELAQSCHGEIVFDNVSMKYAPDLPWVLEDFHLNIRHGQKFGIMGRTGSGKSTLISLLTRLYPYQKGSLRIDGVKVDSLPLNDLRESIGFVSQTAYLLPGTLRDNLTLGRTVSDEHLNDSLVATGLGELLSDTQRTLDSIVQPQGSNFSQGEAQLIALTRILIQNPAIFVLDEATANLDAELERKVQQAVERVSQGRSCLFIAHRLSTLTQCERVIILQHGKIVEEIPGSALLKPSAAVLQHLEA